MPGTANSAGRLTIQWECDPPDAGDSWQVTARGTSSNRTTTFTVTGKAARWILPPGTTLQRGDRITSQDGRYYTVFQRDGNLVTYRSGGSAVWATGTDGRGGVRTSMQTDGNLVIYTASNAAVWASGTDGHGGAYARLDNNGYLRIVSASGTVLRSYRW